MLSVSLNDQFKIVKLSIVPQLARVENPLADACERLERDSLYSAKKDTCRIEEYDRFSDAFESPVYRRHAEYVDDLTLMFSRRAC